MKRIYMDYAATTPCDRRVITAMKPFWNERFGNPSSIHHYGQAALEGAKSIADPLKLAKKAVTKTVTKGADLGK